MSLFKKKIKNRDRKYLGYQNLLNFFRGINNEI